MVVSSQRAGVWSRLNRDGVGYNAGIHTGAWGCGVELPILNVGCISLRQRSVLGGVRIRFKDTLKRWENCLDRLGTGITKRYEEMPSVDVTTVYSFVAIGHVQGESGRCCFL